MKKSTTYTSGAKVNNIFCLNSGASTVIKYTGANDQEIMVNTPHTSKETNIGGNNNIPISIGRYLKTITFSVKVLEHSASRTASWFASRIRLILTILRMREPVSH